MIAEILIDEKMANGGLLFLHFSDFHDAKKIFFYCLTFFEDIRNFCTFSMEQSIVPFYCSHTEFSQPYTHNTI